MEGGHLAARLIDAQELWIGRKIEVNKPRVANLRDEKNVGHARRIAVTKAAGSRIPREQRLNATEADCHPMMLPGDDSGGVKAHRIRQMLAHTQIVERVDLAGYRQCDRANAGTTCGVFGQQRRMGSGFLKAFDNRL